MQIAAQDIGETLAEQDLYERLLPLDHARIVELGCGAGVHTRNIAETGVARDIRAYEIDDIQHRKNIQSEHPNNVNFKYGGAENIHEPENSVDIVMMFKSLHHVPFANMGKALAEIHRILKPNGLAYISEPIFAGPFNDVLKLFHDEEQVRLYAFNAIKDAVDNGVFLLEQQVFFASPVHFKDFRELDERIIQATHTEHRLDDQTYAQVQKSFAAHLGENGAHFLAPMRVDLLRKAH